MPPDDDPSQRVKSLEKRVSELEQELAAAKVQQILMDERLLALERSRLFRLWNKVYRAASQLHGGSSDLRVPGDYERWASHEQYQLEQQDHRATIARWRFQPTISVVLETDSRVSLDSLSGQCYSKWQLCRAAPSGRDFYLILHPGDSLPPWSLYFYAQALQHNESAAVLYGDEDTRDSAGTRSNPVFKPDWSPELAASVPYLGRAVMRRGGGDSSPVCRIPKVLYHRAQTAERPDTQPLTETTALHSRFSIVICSRNMARVDECLRAIRTTSEIPHELLLVHHVESGDGRDMRHLLDRYSATWIPYRGPFDFARMNNLGAASATSPYLLFLNDDVSLKAPGWDGAIAARLEQPQVGIVGVILYYPDGTIQHAGVVTGIGDAVGHCGRFQTTSGLWPWLRMSRDVSAVTGAMLSIRTELFHQLAGFDEAFPVNYNDVDLCLRVRDRGLRVVCLNLGQIVHREGRTRTTGTTYQERAALYKRWSKLLANPDPFYSPCLAPMERIALNLNHPLPLSYLVNNT